MRVEAYLRFVAKLRGVPRAKIEPALEHVLEVCGLADMSHRICGQLSKGYRQRVGLAQALIHDPPVLDRKSTRLNSSHLAISDAVFCLKKIVITPLPVHSPHDVSTLTTASRSPCAR